MNAAVRIAVEEATDAIFQLTYPFRRGFDQGPGQLLIVEVRTSLDRVAEVVVERVSRVQDGVIPTLHHACTSRFAQQSLDGDEDRGAPIGIIGM
jgi:hypothetical protein